MSEKHCDTYPLCGLFSHKKHRAVCHSHIAFSSETLRKKEETDMKQIKTDFKPFFIQLQARVVK